MGQYFAAANTTKKEFVCPWCLGGVAKLWEWAVNPWGAIFTLLLRKSDESGGGDYYGNRMQHLVLDCNNAEDVARTIAAGVAQEGRPVVPDPNTIVGRWAGDSVVLVGDYDSSKLWRELYETHTYKNISREVAETWNDFIEIESMQLKYDRCSTCQDSNTQ